MGHHALLERQSAYGRMIDRLNRFPQGAPESATDSKNLRGSVTLLSSGDPTILHRLARCA